jgi:BirA family biotin operon repressor/biotin-[acetyl-CoA-carboxylase] ligase
VNGERATLVGPFRLVHVPETGSTNTDLVAAAHRGEASGLVLLTDHQTAGKGRLGRSWTAPPGASLLLSVLLDVPLGAPLHGATQAVALAACAACWAEAGVAPTLKWPNDLLVGDRKLAGVLAEAVTQDGRIRQVVVGIGLNVRWGDEVPEELAARLVSLDHLSERVVRPFDLVPPLLTALADRLDEWEHRPAELHRAYRRALATLGRDVRVELSQRTFSGRAVDVRADGALVVHANGDDVVVDAGEVVHLR